MTRSRFDEFAFISPPVSWFYVFRRTKWHSSGIINQNDNPLMGAEVSPIGRGRRPAPAATKCRQALTRYTMYRCNAGRHTGDGQGRHEYPIMFYEPVHWRSPEI